MRFPRAVSIDDLPHPARGGGKAPGRLAQTAWRLSPSNDPRPAFSMIATSEPEHYATAAVLNPATNLEAFAPDHFLRYPEYQALPFVRGVGDDIAYTRIAKAIAAPGLGFIDQFNVGGGANIPDTLLEGELVREPGDVFVADGDVERVAGLSVPLCHYGYSAFGHFVLDALLQVFVWERALHAGDMRLVHWPLQDSWMQPILSACGVPAQAQRELRHPVALLQRAGLSSALAAYGVYYPAAYSRAFFLWLSAKFDVAPRSTLEKLYVRRSGGSPRPIENGGELEALAVRHGFRILDPGEHSFAEQVRAFASARVVLSAWGSTLTLAPLLRGERRVIELLPDTVTDIWFLRQAAVHGLDYLPVLQKGDASGGFSADLEALERTLMALDEPGL